MLTLELAGNTTRMNVASGMVDILLRTQLLQYHLIINLPTKKKKQEVLTWINTLLKQVKSSIDNNLNPAKVNVIHPTKDNFSQPVSVKEILYEILLIRIITEPCPYQQINI